MDEQVAKDIRTVISAVIQRTRKNAGGAVFDAAQRLAAEFDYHVIKNENCYYLPEGARREVPGLKKVCSCGWESGIYSDYKLSTQEAHMHELSVSKDFEVD